MLTTNRFIVVLMLAFFTTTAMMRELPVIETKTTRASVVVKRSAGVEIDKGPVSLVTFSNAMFKISVLKMARI